ncbi:MAG TPA: hypothetical protein VLA19_13400 [Herpetosiphonaceae bacterium]|nr:hypothetical protein [Herpetosiphonaceae bacterium]
MHVGNDLRRFWRDRAIVPNAVVEVDAAVWVVGGEVEANTGVVTLAVGAKGLVKRSPALRFVRAGNLSSRYATR